MYMITVVVTVYTIIYMICVFVVCKWCYSCSKVEFAQRLFEIRTPGDGVSPKSTSLSLSGTSRCLRGLLPKAMIQM